MHDNGAHDEEIARIMRDAALDVSVINEVALMFANDDHEENDDENMNINELDLLAWAPMHSILTPMINTWSDAEVDRFMRDQAERRIFARTGPSRRISVRTAVPRPLPCLRTFMRA